MSENMMKELASLTSLLAPDAEDSRSSVSPPDLHGALGETVDEMLDRVEIAIHQVALDSRILADLFWEEAMDRFEQKDPGILGVRVRINKGTLEVAYFRNAFTKKGGSKRDSAFYAKHIRKSGKYRYSARDFSGATEWEKAMALEHEEIHERNRRLFAELSKARRYLRQLKKLMSKMDD